MNLGGHTEAILRDVPGAWACGVVGFDGLPLALRAADGRGDALEAWMAELAAPMAALRRAPAPEPGQGGWSDLVLALPGGGHLVARALGEAHFVALWAGPEALSGRARYVLRLHAEGLWRALFPGP